MKKLYLSIFSTLLLASGAFLLPGCSEGEENLSENGNDSGEVSLTLRTDPGPSAIEIVGTSKAGAEALQLDAADFAVEIINAQGNVSKHWDRYGEMPEKVRLNTGNYTMRALYGSDREAGFDSPYFLGEAPFTIAGQQSRQVEVTCKLAGCMAAIVYGGQIAQDYTDFRTEITSGRSNTVTFGKNETRPAYFPAGELNLKIYLTDEDGKTRLYTPAPIEAAPQDFITLYIDTKDATGELTLSIRTETATTDREVTVDLPTFTLPKPAPTMLVSGFDETTGEISTTEGVVTEEAKVHVRADGGIAGCTIRVQSPLLLEMGWPEEFDLADLTPETEELLKSSGLNWSGNLRNATLADIDFSGLSSILTTEHLGTELDTPTPYRFTISVTDAFGQRSEERTVSFSVAPPVFTVAEIGPGDIWATKAEVHITVTAGNPDLFIVQRQTESGEWRPCTSEKIVSGNEIAITAKPLPSSAATGTPVALRVRYNAHHSDPQHITTEASTQVPNGDFETYCLYKYNSGNDIDQYFWYASQDTEDKWWATRNPASASQLTSSAIGGKNFYTRNNGTSPVDNGSGKAVQLQTTAWGRGNTSIVNGGGTKNNITAGLLYIGEYSYTLSESGGTLTAGKGVMDTETITQGHAFGSRPARMSFQYKYAPINNESFQAYATIENRDNGTVELARAEVPAATAAAAVGEMTDLTLDFVYDERYKHVKATHICIFFASSTKMGWKDGDDRPATTNSGTGSMHYGSTLTIDNLKLDYNF